MAVCEIHFTQSQSVLEKMTSATVIVPEGKAGPFPVLYLLHGLGHDHTAWTRHTAIERYVEGLPLIVVMPDGERGFYTDSRSNPKAAYETSLVRDVLGFVDRAFQTIPRREGRVIAGLSMGGYGALKLALKHPDKFCAAYSLSGALSKGSTDYRGDWGREWAALFGPTPEGGPDDLVRIAATADRDRLPALGLDCGADDLLLGESRHLHRRLTDLGIPHEYAERPGDHDWRYWDRAVRHALTFLCGRLGLREFLPQDLL